MTILTYHSIPVQPTSPYAVTVDQFRAQMEWLAAREFVGISLERALAADAPARSVVLTLDDAYRSITANAAPILSELGFSATVFVPAACVGGTNAWDAGAYPEESLATWEELRDWQARGFGIGSHGLTHARLTRLPWRERVHEIAHSRALLAEHVGTPPVTFSYPWGACSPATAWVAALAGYRAAVGSAKSRLVPPRLRLPRLQVDAGTTLEGFAEHLAGAMRGEN
jgi:peptidoglycan/xylan/chitin deacetylase (PgdA/CDA1 family)